MLSIHPVTTNGSLDFELGGLAAGLAGCKPGLRWKSCFSFGKKTSFDLSNSVLFLKSSIFMLDKLDCLHFCRDVSLLDHRCHQLNCRGDGSVFSSTRPQEVEQAEAYVHTHTRPDTQYR